MKKTEGLNRGKKKHRVVQFHMEQHPTQEISRKEQWLHFAVCYVALLLLGFGSIRMYGDVFKVGEAFVKTGCVALALYAAFFVAWHELFRKKKYRNLILFLLFVGYGAVRFRTLYKGLTIIVNEILQFLNDYYTMQIPMLEAQKAGGAVEMLLFLLGLFVWQMAYAICAKRNLIFALLPGLCIFFLELLVGYAPKNLGTFCFVAGGSIGAVWCSGKKAQAGESLAGVRVRAAVIVLTTFVISGAIAALAGTELSTTILTKQKQMLAYQQYLERSVVEGQFFSYLQGESGKVNNHTPYYLGKEVLEVSVEKQMRENIYLRGYVGDTYQGGTWKNQSKKLFESEAASWGEEDAQKAGFDILNLLYTNQKQSGGAERGTYTISYVAPGNKYAYFPYYTKDDAEETSVVADTMIFRKNQEEITVSGLYNQSLLTVLENGAYTEKTAAEQQYQEYVKRYLALPDDLPELDRLGEELRGRLEETGVEDDSLLKAAAAVSLVRSEVNTRVSYSKKLEQMPAGADVVEYFLFTSGKGYCTHYASAGVLLLRELGVPARYVSGYVVGKEDFQKDEDGRYTAKVLDSDAHAWVEIFVSGIGWIPIEMIEGSDTRLDSLRMITAADGSYGIAFEDNKSYTQVYAFDGEASEAGLSDWLEEAAGEKIVTEEAQTDAAAGTETKSEAEVTTSTEQNQAEAAAKSVSTEHTIEPQKDSPAKQKETVFKLTTTQKVVIAAVIVAAVAGAAGMTFLFSKKKKLYASFTQENHRKAVQSITTQMYHLLRKKGALREKNPDDAAFVNALLAQEGIFTEEEVGKLCRVMEQAAFGREEISTADVRFCHKMYRKLLK